MGKLDEKVEDYYTKMTGKMGMTVDKDLLRAISKNLGPNLYKADASKVSTTDAAEMETVRNNFLIKKLGLKDDAKLDAALEMAAGKFESSDKSKFRAIFYYILVKEFKKESVYA